MCQKKDFLFCEYSRVITLSLQSFMKKFTTVFSTDVTQLWNTFSTPSCETWSATGLHSKTKYPSAILTHCWPEPKQACCSVLHSASVPTQLSSQAYLCYPYIAGEPQMSPMLSIPLSSKLGAVCLLVSLLLVLGCSGFMCFSQHL